MAGLRRIRIPIERYGDGPEAKLLWDAREMEKLSLPAPKTCEEVLEEEREAKEAKKKQRQLWDETFKLAPTILSPQEYIVFHYDLEDWSDERIAHNSKSPPCCSKANN